MSPLGYERHLDSIAIGSMDTRQRVGRTFSPSTTKCVLTKQFTLPVVEIFDSEEVL